MAHTILLVDNDIASRRMLERAICQNLGYHVVTLATAHEAIEYIKTPHRSAVDGVLIDMAISLASTLKVIHGVKAIKPELPVIIMTSYGQHDHATAAIAAGASDFLVKPLAIERLGLSLANAVRVYQLHQTIKQLEQRLAEDGIAIPDIYAGKIHVSPLVDDDGKVKKLRTLEEEAIRNALAACGGSMTQAARSLGIGRSTLYRKVGEFDRFAKNAPHNTVYISRANQTTRPMIDISPAERS